MKPFSFTTSAARLWLPCLLLAGGAVHAQESRRVSGTVVDSGGQPISYVNIDGGPRFGSLSGGDGQFHLSVPANKPIRVAFRRIGYLPVSVDLPAGGDTSLTVTMAQQAVLMESQIIRAREQVRALATHGFYERMSQGINGALVGEFVTPEEIELRHPQRTTQLLEQRRGIRVKRVGNCYVITTCYRILGPNDCVATVYLDGHRLNRLSDPAAAPSAAAPEVDDMIPVTSIAAIEIYPRGSSAPPRYQSLAGTCGVVVIWTK